MKALGPGNDDSAQDLHMLVLPYAHSELWADFTASLEGHDETKV